MKFNHFKPLLELEKVFEHLPSFSRGLALDTDVSEDNEKVTVEMHLAGVKPDNVDIEVNEHILRVTGFREEEKEKEGKHFFKKEIQRGSFEHMVALPVNVQTDGAEATFEHGVLKIILLKEKGQHAHKIKIKAH